MRRTVARFVTTVAVTATLTGPALPGKTPAASAESSTAWWCDPAAMLTLANLPDVLPVSACSLTGRVIRGQIIGAEVPPAGRGVAPSVYGAEPGVSESFTIWADDYGVHVRGGSYDAALGYLDAVDGFLTDGTGERSDLTRMAASTRSIVVGSVGRVEPASVPTSALLDAADTLVDGLPATGPAGSSDSLAAAVAVLRAHLNDLAVGVDASPTVQQIAGYAEELRGYVRDGVVAGADPLLTKAVVVANYLVSELLTAADPATVQWLVDTMTQLVAALRARIANGDLQTGGGGGDAPEESAVGAVLDYLYGQLPEAPDGVSVGPIPGEPYPNDPTDGQLAQTGQSPHPCRDPDRKYAFPNLAHWERGRQISWWYNYTGQFPRYSATGYRNAMVAGFSGMTGLSDDCGYTWHPNIGHVFRGFDPDEAPSFNPLMAYCPEFGNGRSVVAWRAQAPSVGAATCAFLNVYGTEIVEADIIFNSNETYDIPELDSAIEYRCNGDMDVQSVMTHEVGHALGLGHVTEQNHGNLTMSTALNGDCQRSERTLGLGDAKGLHVLYGQVW